MTRPTVLLTGEFHPDGLDVLLQPCIVRSVNPHNRPALFTQAADVEAGARRKEQA